jgi:hypothetical protein
MEQLSDEEIGKMLSRAEQAEDALRSVESILWMAHRYAEAGGGSGPEMEDFRHVMRTLEKYHKASGSRRNYASHLAAGCTD